ncbi:unnamed protein product [Mytilus edulis]|uniref:C2H2-type domain-containing protein n=1 Tax=Mytilus edulis TaxID=6550 RepID=A0A8S3UEK2_MYTED|nr:unnamed protein product [Mytilus edulis]
MPQINEVFIRSDNAGCYYCAPLWLSLYGISSRTGITIKRYDYSEAQAGKSYCDLKIAHMRGKMRVYAASGHNITTAADMKKALDSGTGVVECERVETSRNDKNENLVTDTSEDNVEIQENVLEISEPNNNNESEQRLQSSTFFCSEPGCSKIYQSYNSLKNHILTGKHEFKNTISTYDNIRNKWAENCQSMSTEAMPQTFTDTNLQVVNKEAVAIG